MTTKKADTAKQYRVANPRGVREGRFIIRVGERRWYEGDLYDGPVTSRFLKDGFLVEVP